jgi:hypothetical protein
VKLNLIIRKERWCLTRRGWLFVCLIFLAGIFIGIRSLVPFLACQKPVQAQVLVLEGWIHDFALPGVRAEFDAGEYQLLLIAGPSIPNGEPFSEFGTYSELTKATLLKQGWNENQIVALKGRDAANHRTRNAALSVRAWVISSPSTVSGINVYSLGLHARRTQLVYQRVLKGTVRVGIISGTDLRFDADRWWASSDGLRLVIYEAFAYLYTLLFGPR